MTESGAALLTGLTECPLLGILRGHPSERTVEAVEAAVQAGLRVVEVTLDSPDAISQLRSLSSALDESVLLGAGTVLNAEQVDDAARAGARFVVSPHLVAAVVARAASLGLATIPGAFTPSELAAAWNAGGALVKLFPAGPAGTAYVQALRGPYPDVPLLVTGGIDVDRASDFLDAGATAVGLGSQLFGSARAPVEPEGVAMRTRALVARLS